MKRTAHRIASAMRLAADHQLLLWVRRLVDQLLPGHVAAFRSITGQEPQLAPLHIRVTADGLEEKGKIGVHVPPNEDHAYSILKVHPKAFSRSLDYVEQVVRHELIHYVANGAGKDAIHGQMFNLMADRLGLPPKLRD